MLQGNILIRFNLKLATISTFKFFSHLLRLPISFYASRSVGELASRVNMNDHVAGFISEQLAANILSFITLFFYAVLLLVYDPVLGSCSIVSAVIIIFLLRREIRSRRVLSQTLQGKKFEG